jgi:formate hydrogenlyase subunit 6/NADH:ubiquinone oxidoreductase subunit I
MNIFQVIAGNLQRDPITLRFPERVAPPEGFRGRVQLDPERCVGCATCVYVCTSSAVSVADYPKEKLRISTHYEWVYDPGRCTFCGRCVDFCPSQALTMEAERPPIYTQPGALRQVHRLAYPVCPECGQPAHPVNDRVLARAFDEITDEVREWSRLCERCRQRRYQPALIKIGYTGRSEDHGR